MLFVTLNGVEGSSDFFLMVSTLTTRRDSLTLFYSSSTLPIYSASTAFPKMIRVQPFS